MYPLKGTSTNGVPTRQPFLADVRYVTLNEQRYCHPVVCHPNSIHITYPSLKLKKGEGVFIFSSSTARGYIIHRTYNYHAPLGDVI